MAGQVVGEVEQPLNLLAVNGRTAGRASSSPGYAGVTQTCLVVRGTG